MVIERMSIVGVLVSSEGDSICVRERQRGSGEKWSMESKVNVHLLLLLPSLSAFIAFTPTYLIFPFPSSLLLLSFTICRQNCGLSTQQPSSSPSLIATPLQIKNDRESCYLLQQSLTLTPSTLSSPLSPPSSSSVCR